MANGMKIAIVGCGAMGAIYAGLLAARGRDVIAIAPSVEHVVAMAERGLRVERAGGDRVVRLRACIEVQAEQVDLVIFAVKAAHAATRRCRRVRCWDPAMFTTTACPRCA